MKLFNATLRRIVTITTLIALVMAVVILIKSRAQSPLTAQFSASLAAATSTSTSPGFFVFSATDTLTPIPSPPSLTPIQTTPYKVFAATPESGPTYTPTPQSIEAADIDSPAVSVIDAYKLPMEQLESLRFC